MNREKQLIKNTGILAIGKICTQFVSFFLLPLYTSYLSTKEYGTVDLLNNYITLLIPIFYFQIEQSLFRFLIDARNNKNDQKSIISTVIFTIIIQSLVFIIFYLIVSIFIKNNYKYFLLTNVIAAAISSLLLQMCRGLGDNFSYSLGSLVTGISTIVLNVIFITIFNMGANGMLLGTLLANLICILFIFFRKKVYKYIDLKKYNSALRKKMWEFSIPLIPNQLSWWIVNVSDRTLISNFISIGANGIYSVSNKFSAICISVFNFFNLTWSESASVHINDNDSSEFFSNILNTSVRFFSSICIFIISIIPFIFKFLVTNPEYNGAYNQIPILMISTIFNIIVSLLGSIYIALKKSNEIAKTSILAAIINILFNLILIKKIGLYAASISTLVAYMSMTIYRYIDIQKYLNIKFDFYTIISIIVLIAISIVPYYLNFKILNYISVLFIIILSIVINKKIIKLLISLVKR